MTGVSAASRIVRLVLAVLSVFVCGATRADDPPCAHGYPIDQFEHWVQINGINWRAVVYMSPYALQFWPIQFSPEGAPGGGCVCPGGHKTSAGRGFDHVHVRHSLPQMALLMIGTTVARTELISQQHSNDFWQWEYAIDGYTSFTGPIQNQWTQNCHGYSLGYDTWVNGIQRILTDDGWTVWSPPGDLRYNQSKQVVPILGGDAHSSKWTYTLCPDPPADPVTGMPAITGAIEKFRDSGVFVKSGSCANPAAPKRSFHAESGTDNVNHPPEWSFQLYIKGGGSSSGGSSSGGSSSGGSSSGGGSSGGGSSGGGGPPPGGP